MAQKPRRIVGLRLYRLPNTPQRSDCGFVVYGEHTEEYTMASTCPYTLNHEAITGYFFLLSVSAVEVELCFLVEIFALTLNRRRTRFCDQEFPAEQKNFSRSDLQWDSHQTYLWVSGLAHLGYSSHISCLLHVLKFKLREQIVSNHRVLGHLDRHLHVSNLH